MISFVIGNGSSRGGFDLNKLKSLGTIYGCNALYRNYLPDYLVAIDDGIIDEINQSDFPKDRFIVPPEDERWEPIECNPNRPRSNAGMNAMREAIKKGSDTIICLGFDFLLYDDVQSVSNIYDGTENYGPETRAICNDNVGRIKYLEWLANKNPTIDFVFVYPIDYVKYLKKQRVVANNILINSYDDLLDNIS